MWASARRRQGQPQIAARAAESENAAGTEAGERGGLTEEAWRRPLWGKQKQLGVTTIAKQAQAKANSESISLDLLASAAKEAQQARAQAPEAERRAEVYKVIAENADRIAHDLHERAMQYRTTLWCGSMRLPAQ